MQFNLGTYSGPASYMPKRPRITPENRATALALLDEDDDNDLAKKTAKDTRKKNSFWLEHKTTIIWSIIGAALVIIVSLSLYFVNKSDTFDTFVENGRSPSCVDAFVENGRSPSCVDAFIDKYAIASSIAHNPDLHGDYYALRRVAKGIDAEIYVKLQKLPAEQRRDPNIVIKIL
jgi:hypothetical protein